MSRSTVVIVSYRPTEWLTCAIESVADQADEVLVVDNGSENGAATSIARRTGVPSLRLGRNAGFAGGADAGMRGATGDLVAILNDDAIAPPDWLSNAERALADPTVAAVGPKVVLDGRFAELVLGDDEAWFAPGDPRPLGRQLFSATQGGKDVLPALLGALHRIEHDRDVRWRWTAGPGPVYLRAGGAGEEDLPIVVNGEEVTPRRTVTLINAAGSYLRPDGYTGDCGDSSADDGQFAEGRRCFALTGAAIVTTAATIGRIGGLARHYFNYYEDTDWCWRARLAGFDHLYDPSSTVVHVRGQTSGGTSGNRVQYLAERNRLLTLLRNAPLPLARSETWRKRTGGGDDGVAEELWRWAPAGIAGRVRNRRRWRLSPEEVFEQWAGVDVPPGSVDPG